MTLLWNAGPPAIVCLLVAGLFARAFWARSCFELRAQVFELLSLAVARQQPLAPVFLEAREGETGHRGKLLSKLASAFQKGSPVADTLKTAAPRMFGEHHLAAIRSAEGTALLPSTVQALSAEMGRGDLARHQLSMALCYPALLAVCLVIVQMATSSLGRFGVLEMDRSAVLAANLLSSAVFLLCVGVVIVRISLDRTGDIPVWFSRSVCFVPLFARMTRWVAVERALQTLSACVAAGGVFQTALRSAAHSAGHQPTRDEFFAVADCLDAGESIEDALERSRLPAFVVVRVISAASGSTQSFAAGLAQLSRDCGHRFTRDLRRATRWLQPVMLVAFGLALALQFHSLIQALGDCRAEIILW